MPNQFIKNTHTQEYNNRIGQLNDGKYRAVYKRQFSETPLENNIATEDPITIAC